MRFARILAVSAAIVLSFAGAATSEEDPLLGSLINEALIHNPSLVMLKERSRAFEAGARAEGALEDPQFKVELEDLSRSKPFDITPDDAMLTRYTISQSFPFPGKRALREDTAIKEAAAARAEVRSKELEIASMVKEAYYEYAYLSEAASATNDIKETLKLTAKAAEARYSSGQATQQDLIKANLELAMLETEILRLSAERELSAARLKNLANRPVEEALKDPGPLPKKRSSIDIGAILKDAIDKNPGIAMARAEIEAGELSERLARKSYYPDLMVGVAPVERDGRFENFDLMFQVNIPLWREKYASLSEKARLNTSSARARLAAAANTAALEVKSAAIGAESAGRMMALFESSLLPQSELAFESALRNYQAGKVDFLTLLESQRELKRLKLEYLKTVFEYRKSLAAIERTGAGIEEQR